MIKLQKKKIDYAEESRLFSKKNKSSGSISSFLGKVRKESVNGEIKSINIEYYKKMTKKEIKAIMDQVKNKWKIDDFLIIHRFGEILVADNIVLILIASRHRKDSLESIEYVIDWLKVKATFWKKEITKKGEFWVDQKKSDVNKSKSHISNFQKHNF
ncbi:molybdenum cofactor biosynthesis protein MoaE [Rickettsiales bacterium]|nr:molybdenum cofactor biosynthesis protein MoaE [Rickettsiales bacterium]